jgi:prepilin-type N-terminal cleavage/methylation domain-containing protein
MRRAFTLAEVLITLGIIGVVAAITIPTLVQNHRNMVVEKRLQKFYSNINQAILQSEVEYGDKKLWYQDTNSVLVDKDGNYVKGSSTVEKWWNLYIGPYVKTTSIKYNNQGLPVFYFPDGTALLANQTAAMRDWIFFVTDPDKCLNRYGSKSNAAGKCAFMFIYMPGTSTTKNKPVWKYHVEKGFEPYKHSWDGTEKDLYDSKSDYGCNSTQKNAFCTAAIQYNNWKIPKNYPYKVSY